MLTKTATQHIYEGPHGTGARLVRIEEWATGYLVDAHDYRAADKAEAIAIARQHGATLTA